MVKWVLVKVIGELYLYFSIDGHANIPSLIGSRLYFKSPQIF
jgi:hypothetical protein